MAEWPATWRRLDVNVSPMFSCIVRCFGLKSMHWCTAFIKNMPVVKKKLAGLKLFSEDFIARRRAGFLADGTKRIFPSFHGLSGRGAIRLFGMTTVPTGTQPVLPSPPSFSHPRRSQVPAPPSSTPAGGGLSNRFACF